MPGTLMARMRTLFLFFEFFHVHDVVWEVGLEEEEITTRLRLLMR